MSSPTTMTLRCTSCRWSPLARSLDLAQDEMARGGVVCYRYTHRLVCNYVCVCQGVGGWCWVLCMRRAARSAVQRAATVPSRGRQCTPCVTGSLGNLQLPWAAQVAQSKVQQVHLCMTITGCVSKQATDEVQGVRQAGRG